MYDFITSPFGLALCFIIISSLIASLVSTPNAKASAQSKYASFESFVHSIRATHDDYDARYAKFKAKCHTLYPVYTPNEEDFEHWEMNYDELTSVYKNADDSLKVFIMDMAAHDAVERSVELAAPPELIIYSLEQ